MDLEVSYPVITLMMKQHAKDPFKDSNVDMPDPFIERYLLNFLFFAALAESASKDCETLIICALLERKPKLYE